MDEPDIGTALNPTGTSSGEGISNAISSLVRTVSYTGLPSPTEFFALNDITYSLLDSVNLDDYNSEIKIILFNKI